MKTKKEEIIEGEVVESNSLSKFGLARQSAIVKPVDVEGTLEAYRQFEEIKKKLLTDNDYMWFDENGKPTTPDKGKPFIKKSGWRKIKTAFGISIQFLNDGIRTEGVDKEGKYYVWRYKIRGVTPNGIYQDGDGAASSRKAFFSKKYGTRIDPEEEDIILTAQTVGINRVISDLVGGGEVSAEEMIGKNQSMNKAIITSKNTATDNSNKTFDWSKLDLNKKPFWGYGDKRKTPPIVKRLYAIAKRLISPKEEIEITFHSITNKEHSYEYTYGDIKKIDEYLQKLENDISVETDEEVEKDFIDSEQDKLKV